MQVTAKRLLPLLVLPLLIAGCTTPNITNLTPSAQQRNPANLYPVEAAFDSRQQSMIWDSIEAYALVGHERYPMKPTPLVQNRWETLIPVPPGRDVIHYRFRFDWEYKGIPQARPDSDLSPEYRLHIID